MANHKSAEKRIRVTAAKTEANANIRGRVRTFVKKAEIAIASGNKEEATAAFIKAESELGKGRSKGIVKKNTVARKVSRLAKKLKAVCVEQ